MSSYNYSFNDVHCILGGLPITEFEDGDGISWSLPGDAFSVKRGAHKSVTRSRLNNDSSLDVTLKISQSSPLNDYLSGRAKIDQLTGLGSFTFMVKDGFGTSLLAARVAWVKKLPDGAFGTESGSREWGLTLANPEIHVGGNFPII